MTDRDETPITEPNWRALTEQTDYRVLTLPTGETISADCIASVRMGEASDPVGSFVGGQRRRTIIDACAAASPYGWQDRAGVNIIVYDEPDAVFEVATRAHRMHGGPR